MANAASQYCKSLLVAGKRHNIIGSAHARLCVVLLGEDRPIVGDAIVAGGQVGRVTPLALVARWLEDILRGYELAHNWFYFLMAMSTLIGGLPNRPPTSDLRPPTER